jgi:hypothetical protein
MPDPVESRAEGSFECTQTPVCPDFTCYIDDKQGREEYPPALVEQREKAHCFKGLEALRLTECANFPTR